MRFVLRTMRILGAIREEMVPAISIIDPAR
jgi:hypothetical protein